MNTEKKGFENVVLKYKIWMENTDGDNLLGDGKWQLLKTIQEESSLMAAVKKMGLSYRKTWDNLKKIEQTIGVNLLEKSSGGAQGGKSVLTREGIKLVKAFDDFHSTMDIHINKAFNDFYKQINK